MTVHCIYYKTSESTRINEQILFSYHNKKAKFHVVEPYYMRRSSPLELFRKSRVV